MPRTGNEGSEGPAPRHVPPEGFFRARRLPGARRSEGTDDPSPARRDPSPRRVFAWLYVGCVVAAYGVFLLTILSLLVADTLGLGNAGLGIAFASLSVGGFTSPFIAGMFADRTGPRPVSLAGLVCVMGGGALAAWSPDPIVLVAGVFLLGAGFSMYNVMGYAWINEALGPRKGAYLGVYVTGIGRGADGREGRSEGRRCAWPIVSNSGAGGGAMSRARVVPTAEIALPRRRAEGLMRRRHVENSPRNPVLRCRYRAYPRVAGPLRRRLYRPMQIEARAPLRDPSPAADAGREHQPRACAVCGGHDRAPFWQGNGMTLLRCRGCGRVAACSVELGQPVEVEVRLVADDHVPDRRHHRHDRGGVRGEVGLITANIGWAAGVVSAGTYSLVVLVVLVTTLVTPGALQMLFSGQPHAPHVLPSVVAAEVEPNS